MANFLTEGRTALLAAFQNDAGMADRVRKWFEFGSGLRERLDTLPSNCPFFAMYPATGSVEQPYNAAREIPYDLEVAIGTDGQDAEPIEELVALVIERVKASRDRLLGLSEEGLRSITILSIDWRAWEDEKAARIVWEAVLRIRMMWIRT